MKNKVKILLAASLFLNAGFLAAAFYRLQQSGGLRIQSNQAALIERQGFETPYYLTKKSIFDASSAPVPRQTVFLGDSLTDYGLWNEWFDSSRLDSRGVANRGIAGDTLEGVLHRLDEVSALKPKKVFLMVGINDLGGGRKAGWMIGRYGKILRKLKAKCPAAQIYVQSVLPVNNRIYGSKINNRDVADLNRQLKLLAREQGAVFIDLYSLMSDGVQLRDDLTFDGLHLNGKAYAIWKGAIAKFVAP